MHVVLLYFPFKYSIFTGVILAESVASADVSSRARLNQI